MKKHISNESTGRHLLPIIAVGLLVCGFSPAASAATITVNSAVDPGDGVCGETECALREAIAAASPSDTIDFDVGLNGRTIVLDPASDRLVVDKNLTIQGPGRDEQQSK